MTIAQRSLAVLAAAAAAVSISACSKTVDGDDLEGQLKDQLAPQLDVSAEEVSVSCPDDQELKKGAEFDCELTGIGDETARIVVTLKDDEGNYTANIPPAELQKLAKAAG
ncbi:MAG TPA: DUF4333 domain-containing protein [Capillimicrobium sp.]|nr:DUF4333 domain-containing protein [Capillimicrobium sp.]